MNMNMQNLMSQARKLQNDMERITKEIEETNFIGESGAVKVEVSGKNIVNKITITDEGILNDKEMLEDMTLIAINDALSKIKKIKNEKLGKFTGGLGGIF